VGRAAPPPPPGAPPAPRPPPPPADAFVADIVAELARHVADAPWAGRPARSVYLGGGTPSLLPPGPVAALLDAVARLSGIVAAAEVTIEANPGTVTPTSLAGYRRAGVTRLSLGAQSFSPPSLAMLGRDHPPHAL